MTGMCDNAATMLQAVPPPPDNTDNLVTLEEAAKRLGVSIRTIRRRIKAGELSASMDNGRRMVSLPDVPDITSPPIGPTVCGPPGGTLRSSSSSAIRASSCDKRGGTAPDMSLSWADIVSAVAGLSLEIVPAQPSGLLLDPLREEAQYHRLRPVPAVGLYGERGLAGEHAAVWLYGENLTLEYADEPLARYGVRYQPGGKGLLDASEKQLYDTPYRSPQPPLWELGDGGWLKVVRLPAYAPRSQCLPAAVQAVLPV